jgi:GntR family transcriptional regulator, transcriptional repressor for pyruvate dehydrogenase complex
MEIDNNILPKLTKQTLVNDFITHFEKMIISGKLAIGEKLPSERDLAARIGVSRPVVHEGLIDLAAKGLVSRPGNGGAIINDFRKDGSLFMLNSLLSYNKGILEPKLAESTMDFRLLVEVEFARLAAKNRTEAQLEELRGILAEEKTADINDKEAISQIDFRFHHLIAFATGNIFYPLLLNSFKELYINGTLLFFSDPALTTQVFDFHILLVDAIHKHDELAAANVMRSMLEHGKINYMKMVSK